MLNYLALALLLLLPSCGILGSAFSSQRPSGKKSSQENSPYLKNVGTPLETDIPPGADSLLQALTDEKKKNQELGLEVKLLRTEVQDNSQEVRRLEADRAFERNAKIVSEAQKSAKEKEIRELMARLLNLRIEKSKLQQKIYLLEMVAGDKEMSNLIKRNPNTATARPLPGGKD